MAKMQLTKKLLVEGNDDLHVAKALCEKYNVPETFEVIDSKGIDKLFASIPVILKQSDISIIGIVVDADADINSRWQSLKNILVKEGYSSLPATPPSTGLIHEEVNKPTIGIWLMPDNNANGMLEDFIRFLVPANNGLIPIVESTLNSIESQRLSLYAPIHKSKALIHTWLAWQKDPGTPMGFSITKKYLTSNVPQCALFVDWLRELFKP